MLARPQLSVTELRRAARHPVDLSVIAAHRLQGDIPLHIVNLSAHGFMVRGDPAMPRGERLTVRLPEIGRIEAFIVWKTDDRAGFQFERILRQDLFSKLVSASRLRHPARFR